MTFTLYPAIDLKDGQCVRLLRGEMDQATVFSDSPAAQAKSFRDAGFTHLHVVDLNGAFEGKAVNRAAVEAILKATDAPVQLGGGIRTRAQIDAWLEAGISRVILGTVALRDPELVKAKPPAPCPARSWSASMRRMAWWRSKAGPRPAT
jgi:phosphoribosylformimino-5-aminoimidazole carboxamide ribotide isomerase